MIIYDLNQIDAIVQELFLLLNKYNIFAFYGDLGVGKTTIIKKILKKAGVGDIVLSPTYNYLNKYNNKEKTFYHFDLYRIKDLKSFQEFGFDEILNEENSIIFIEWPEIIESLLNKKICFIYLEHYNIDKRKLTYKFK